MSNPVIEDDLVEQEHALRVYLGSLLSDGPQQAEPSENKAIQLKKRASAPAALPAENNHIVSAEEKLTLMTFKVAGVRLSVPLKLFSGIQTLVDEVDIRHQHEWYAGVISSGEQQIHIIDTYRLVIPKQKQTDDRLQTDYYGKTVLLLNRGTLGLLCDEATKVTSLFDKDVSWRQDKTARAWLAGTIASHSMALLNVDSLNKMVKDHLSGTKTADISR